MASVFRQAGFEVTIETNGDPYYASRVAGYVNTPTCRCPGHPVIGDLLLFGIGCTSKAPITWTGSGFTQVQAVGGSSTSDTLALGQRTCDGTEGGTVLQAVTSLGPHDWLSIAILIHSTDGKTITLANSNAIYTDLGSTSSGAVTAPTGTTTVTTNDLVLLVTSLASLGVAGTISSMTLPSGFEELRRVCDGVIEFISCQAKIIPVAGTVATYSGAFVATAADTLRSFCIALVIQNQTPHLTIGNPAPDYNVGDVASGTYSATGTGPWTFSVTSGTLPFAVSASGVRSGTIGATTGPFTGNVHAVDSLGVAGDLVEVVNVSAGGSAAAWNPTDKTAQATLANSNTDFSSTSTSTSAFGAVRATNVITGKRRIQATLTGATGSTFSISLGLSDSAVPMNAAFDPGGVANSCGFVLGAGGNSARVYENLSSRLWPSDATLAALTATTYTVDILVDQPTRKYWIAVAGTGAYIGGGNPVTGTTPTGTLGGTGSILLCAADDQGATISGKKVHMTGDPSGYTGIPVSGFTDGF